MSHETPRWQELPVTLPSLAIAVVKVPEEMSELDFLTLVNTINSWKQALVGPKNDNIDDMKRSEDNEGE